MKPLLNIHLPNGSAIRFADEKAALFFITDVSAVVRNLATESDVAICFGCYVGARGEQGELAPLLAAEDLGILRIEAGCSHGPTTIVYVVPSERAGFEQLLDRDCGCDCEMCEDRRAVRPRLVLVE